MCDILILLREIDPQDPGLQPAMASTRAALCTLYVEDAAGYVGWPANMDQDAFSASVIASRAHIQKHCYDHNGGSGPCLHPFVEGWDLGRCSSCGADLGAGRRAAEQAAGRIAEDEDACCSTTSGTSSAALSPTTRKVGCSSFVISPHARQLRRWGVRVDWLVAFTFAHDCWEWPTWRVMRDVVKPATE